MPFRVSYRKIQQVGPRLGGWSENFWNNGSDLTSLQPIVQSLGDSLESLTGKQAYTASARISDPDTFRKVKNIVLHTSAPSPPSWPDADYPSSSLLLKFTTPDPYVVRQWMRGIPDDVVTGGGVYNPGAVAQYAGRMNTFLGKLMDGSNGWCLRVLAKSSLPKPITAFNVATGIVTVPGHNFGAAGAVTKVRIKGFTVPRAVNDVWQISVIDPNTFQLNFYQAPSPVVPAVANNPTARVQIYTYVPIQKAEVDRATSHYTGRPIELLGGRRRTRKQIVVGVPAAP